MIGLDAYLKADNARYERKFYIENLSPREVEAILYSHPQAFSEIYQQRNVNNIYFDTQRKLSYYDAVNGLNNRMKARIRWYGCLLGKIENPALELKCKRGLLSFKQSYALAPFDLDEAFSMHTLGGVFDRSDLPDHLEVEMKALECSLLNRYSRKYFLSVNGHFRATLDSRLEVYRLAPFGNRFMNVMKNDKAVILEIKYDQAHDELIESITNAFPFRMTKSSKYVQGIEKLAYYT